MLLSDSASPLFPRINGTCVYELRPVFVTSAPFRARRVLKKWRTHRASLLVKSQISFDCFQALAIFMLATTDGVHGPGL
jgi:hypothetical protein